MKEAGWSMSGYARSLQERNVTTSDPTVRRPGDKSGEGVDAAQAVCVCVCWCLLCGRATCACVCKDVACESMHIKYNDEHVNIHTIHASYRFPHTALQQDTSASKGLPGVPTVKWGPDLAYWGVKEIHMPQANGFGVCCLNC